LKSPFIGGDSALNDMTNKLNEVGEKLSTFAKGNTPFTLILGETLFLLFTVFLRFFVA